MATGTLVAVGPAPFESAVLRAASTDGLHVVRRCVDVADLLASAATRQAEVALVSASLLGLDSQVVSQLSDEHVATIAVVADQMSEDAVVLRRLGVDLLVSATELDVLAGSVAQVLQGGAAHRGSASGPDGGPSGAFDTTRIEPAGKVVAVWGPTGAPGRSVLALALASACAAGGIATLLVDADVYGGAQAQLLGLLDESSGLLAAARSANHGRLDREQLAGHARSVSPTLRVLSGLPRSDRWVELAPVLLRRILDIGRDVATLTVVDCGFCLELDEELSYDVAAPRRNGATLTALEQADLVLVIGSADPVGLGRLLRAVADLRVMLPDVQPRLVVNRTRPALGWSSADVAAMVRRTSALEIEAFLPDDPAACDRALVQGQSLVECAAGSKLAKAVAGLADRLCTDLALPDRATRQRQRLTRR